MLGKGRKEELDPEGSGRAAGITGLTPTSRDFQQDLINFMAKGLGLDGQDEMNIEQGLHQGIVGLQ